MIDIEKAFHDQFQDFGQDFKQGKEDGANLELCRSDKHEYLQGYCQNLEGVSDDRKTNSNLG